MTTLFTIAAILVCGDPSMGNPNQTATDWLDAVYDSRLTIGTFHVKVTVVHLRKDLDGKEMRRKYDLEHFQEGDRYFLKEVDLEPGTATRQDRLQCHGCTTDGLTHIYDKNAGWHGAVKDDHLFAATAKFDLRLVGLKAALPQTAKTNDAKFYKLPIYLSPVVLPSTSSELIIIEQKRKDLKKQLHYTLTNAKTPRILQYVLTEDDTRNEYKVQYDPAFSNKFPKTVNIKLVSKRKMDQIDIETIEYSESIPKNIFQPSRIGLSNDTIVDEIYSKGKSPNVLRSKIVKDGNTKDITLDDVKRLQGNTNLVEPPFVARTRNRNTWEFYLIATLFCVSALCGGWFFLRRRRS